MVGEDAHLHRRVEGVFDLLLGVSGFAHEAIALGLFHGTVHDAFDLFWLEVTREGCIGFLALFFEETLLHVLHVLCYGFFSVALHARVDSGVNAQSVLIDVVVGTVGLGVLVAEAVERVVVPHVFVDLILLLVP